MFNFNKEETVHKVLEDLTGIDSPDDLTITARYNKTYHLEKFINKLCLAKKKGELDDLIIQGTDEDGFDFVFNIESFTRKVPIKSIKGSDGKFDNDSIKDEIIRFISR